MKLNNKGFAITLVLYGTLVLFLLLIVSLLGILSTYKLRLEKIYPEVTSLSCEIIAADGYQASQTLKIKSSLSNVTYSWDNSSWSVNNTKEDVKEPGKYTGYVKHNVTGETKTCSIKLVIEYQSTTCPSDNLSFTNWRESSTIYTSSCSVYSKNAAVFDNNLWYRVKGTTWRSNGYCPGATDIGTAGGTHQSEEQCKRICSGYLYTIEGTCKTYHNSTAVCTCTPSCVTYSRGGTCSSFIGGIVSSWQTTPITENFKTQVKTRLTFIKE